MTAGQLVIEPGLGALPLDHRALRRMTPPERGRLYDRLQLDREQRSCAEQALRLLRAAESPAVDEATDDAVRRPSRAGGHERLLRDEGTA
jgi:hypothetical protein